MPPKIKLSEIADSMDCQSDTLTAYLNRETGAIEIIPDELTGAAGDGEEPEEAADMFGVDDESQALAREIVESKKWIALPSKFETNDYRIIQDFCLSQKDPGHRDRLLTAIQGRGAFSRFRGAVQELGLLEKWYEFKKSEYSEIARQWCDQNKVEYEE